MSGQKILDGLRDAADGNLARVTIGGVTYVREDASRIAELESACRLGLEAVVRLRCAIYELTGRAHDDLLLATAPNQRALEKALSI